LYLQPADAVVVMTGAAQFPKTSSKTDALADRAVAVAVDSAETAADDDTDHLLPDASSGDT